MKFRSLILPGALVLNLALTAYLLVSREEANDVKPAPSARALESENAMTEFASLQSRVTELQGQFELFSASQPEEGVAAEGASNAELRRLMARLESMEENLSSLESAMDGVDLEAASAKRDELFKGEDGDIKAAEYFEAGKYAIAGEGYLTFLAAHPDHPQHRSIVKKARQAFMRAGNIDKAIAVHEEYMDLYPESRPADLMTLAHMQKESGDYESAAQSAQDSAGLVNDSSKYWNLLYSAWYTQLGDGLDAGLTAHRDVQRQIEAAGLSDSKVAERVREKISEIENQLASEGK